MCLYICIICPTESWVFCLKRKKAELREHLSLCVINPRRKVRPGVQAAPWDQQLVVSWGFSLEG